MENLERPRIRVQYSLNKETFTRGMRLFYSANTRVRNGNIALSIICGLLAVANIVVPIMIPRLSPNTFMLILFTVTAITPWTAVNGSIAKQAEIYADGNNRFTITVYDNCVSLGGGDDFLCYFFARDITAATEDNEFFVLATNSNSAIILPKIYIEPQVQELVRILITNGCGRKFRSRLK